MARKITGNPNAAKDRIAAIQNRGSFPNQRMKHYGRPAFHQLDTFRSTMVVPDEMKRSGPIHSEEARKEKAPQVYGYPASASPQSFGSAVSRPTKRRRR